MATVTFLHARGVVTVWRKLVLRVVALVGAVAAIYGTFVANFPDFSCFCDEEPGGGQAAVCLREPDPENDR